jgi:predicted metal-dependent hydrolase
MSRPRLPPLPVQPRSSRRGLVRTDRLPRLGTCGHATCAVISLRACDVACLGGCRTASEGVNAGNAAVPCSVDDHRLATEGNGLVRNLDQLLAAAYRCRSLRLPFNAVAEPRVEVRRSRRRRSTVSAYRDGATVVVLLPARMSRAEEEHWVAEMVRRLQRSETRRRSPARTSDAALLARCRQLSARYFGGKAEPASVRWVPPMRTRWASCTPVDRTIRVSGRLREVPSWVVDYVLVHELAHLLEPGHGPDFWTLVRKYPKADRAIGYLEGISAAAGLGISDQDDELNPLDQRPSG